MFASNKGDTILPVKSSSDFGPLYWVASRTDSQYYVKLANYGPDEQNVTISIPDTQSGRLSMLAGTQYQGNLPHNITVQTVTSEVKGDGGKYTVTMTAWAIAVLAVS
jgi:alpha-N-arabinofuranosidase